MDLKNFEDIFFKHLEKNGKDCYNDIDEYSGVIQKYFGEKCDIKSIRDFVYNFNIRVLKTEKKEFDKFEGILNHKLFSNVLYEFRNSNIMILACQEGNEKALKWLMTMDINTCIQDKNGCSALMYACKNPELIKVVAYLCDHDKENIHLVDSKGQTAAFYAVENLRALRMLINHEIDINRINYNYDSVLTYCCRNKIYPPLRTLGITKNVDPNIFNDEEKTAAFYLIEEERCLELQQIASKDMNFYFKNSKNETPLSILFKKYAQYYEKREYGKFANIIKIIKVLIDKDVSLNASIDEEGNTPFMYFLMYKDWCSIVYCILHCRDIDFSYKNVHGQSVALLSLGITRDLFFKTVDNDCELDMRKLHTYFLENNTYDRDFVDENGNDLILYSICNSAADLADLLLEEKTEKINYINMNKENLMIMCAKLGSPEIANLLIKKYKFTDIDHQDSKGNTALHYAVQCNDYLVANILAYNQANLNIKNNEGVSPMDLARSDRKMVKYLNKPVAPHKMVDKVKKPTFMPINEVLRNKFRESYGFINILNKYHDYTKDIFCGTEFFENSLNTYFEVRSDSRGRRYDLSRQYVPDCDNLLNFTKSNERYFYLKLAVAIFL